MRSVVGIHAEEGVDVEPGPGFAVERDDLRPLEDRRFMREKRVRRGPLGMLLEEAREARAEIAQRVRLGGKLREVRGDELVKARLADDRADRGEILVEAIEHAEPVDAIVDLQPLERSEPVVRLDHAGGDLGHRLAVLPFPLHAVAPRERAEERGGHEFLDGAQLGGVWIERGHGRR